MGKAIFPDFFYSGRPRLYVIFDTDKALCRLGTRARHKNQLQGIGLII